MSCTVSLYRGILMLAIFSFPVLFGCDSSEEVSSSAHSPSQTWTIMIYAPVDIAEDSIEDDFFDDLNSMEKAPASNNVNVIVQVDTYSKIINGQTTAQRLEIVHDTDPDRLASPTVFDRGEIDSCDPYEVVDFVRWTKTRYPADRYVLILYDHGGSWLGFGGDTLPGSDDEDTYFEYADFKVMFDEIALTSGIDQFDLFGFDACVMASVELAHLVSNPNAPEFPYADYMVASASEQLGGWNYEKSLSDLAANPGMSPLEFGRSLVDRFLEGVHEKEVDQAARREEVKPVNTLSVLNPSRIGAVVTALDEFAVCLRNTLSTQWEAVSYARGHSYDYYFDGPYFLVDVIYFATLLLELSTDVDLKAKATEVISAVRNAVEYKSEESFYHGIGAPIHGGLSITFPQSGGTMVEDGDQLDYRSQSIDFVRMTNWDEFLAEYETFVK